MALNEHDPDATDAVALSSDESQTVTRLCTRITELESELATLREEKAKWLQDFHIQQDAIIQMGGEVATLRDQIKRAAEQEPVTHQFQTSDGAWNNFIDQRHYENTVADGRWPIRALYTKEPK